MMYDCDGVDFDGLKNPYDGERLAVKMLVRPGGEPLFAAPGAYAPCAARAESSVEAYRLWDRVDGKEGLRTAQRMPVTCAWTGEPLSMRKTGRGWTLSGGFDPTVFRPRDEFLYYAEMRGGASPRPKPGAGSRVEQPPRRARVTERHRQGVEERAAKLGEDSVRAGEAILKAVGADPSPTVSMSVPGKSGRKARGR